MDNAFQSDRYPEGVPAELTANTRWAWSNAELTTVYPTDAYTLRFDFNLLSSAGGQQSVTASKVDGAHVVEMVKADNSDWSPGEYVYQAVIVRDSDSEEVVAEEGYLTVKAPLSAGGDTRSETLKVLQAIQAVIAKSATKEQQSYSVAGRQLSRRSIPELMELEREYRDRWIAEKAAMDRARGRPVTGRRVRARLGA